MASGPVHSSSVAGALYQGEVFHPIPQNEEGMALRGFLTTSEKLFLIFAAPAVSRPLQEGHLLIHIGTADYMQKAFRHWVDCFWEERQISMAKPSSEELDVAMIISSIWEKSKKSIERILKFAGNAEAIATEQERLDLADEKFKELQQDGCSGRVFTQTQVISMRDAEFGCLEDFSHIPSKNRLT